MSEDWLAAEERRSVLRRVAAYRDLQKTVRRSSTGSLFFGALMIGIWYMLFGQANNFGTFSIVYLILGSLELSVGLWNRLSPHAEGVFFDGAVLLLFGGATLLRQVLIWQGVLPGFRNPLSYFIGAYWLWQGLSHVRTYFTLRKAFAERPTAEHLRWFDDLIREIRTGNPEVDNDLLDLPSTPPVMAKLLGDTAIVWFPNTAETMIVSHDDLEIEPGEPDREGRLPQASLTVAGIDFDDFTLHPENWRNYSRWKAEVGKRGAS